MRFDTRSARWLAGLASAVCTATGCTLEPLVPAGAPYLAVFVIVDAPPEVREAGPYRFRVRELSGTVRYDTTFSATAADTIILSVEAATYVVEIQDVPTRCGVREGSIRYVEVPPNTNTSIARFLLNCRNALTLTVLSDGNLVDSQYIYTVTSSGPRSYAGSLAADDTVLIDNVPAGDYVASLRHIADNCTVVSEGGESVNFTISSAGGASVAFRVNCSTLSRRPRVVSFAGTYRQGSVGFVLRVVDPDKDVERYSWDITDCKRRSILPGGRRNRGAFSGWPNVTNQDTAVIIAGFDVQLPDSVLARSCHAVFVGDEGGNSSEIAEIPLRAGRIEELPAVARFNAVYLGTQALRTVLEVRDPNDDFVGVFTVYSVRDGIVVLPPDGQPDRIVFESPGIIGYAIPEIPFDIGYGTWSDYLGVTVYLLDRSGNLSKVEDTDLFR